ncbi:hypothetical protein [Rhizobium phage RHEph12]|nr:hypothetical protein [Rhizobium phage RHEph12]
MSKIIFLCGSSSVGKTTIMHALEKHGAKPVVMSFRHVRAKLNNPSWADLGRKTALARQQQTLGFDIYRERLTEASSWKDDETYVFERCPVDIAGYSHSFRLNKLAMEMVEESISLFKLLADVHKVALVYRPVDMAFRYDRDNNARPSMHVRMKCDSFIDTNIDYVAQALSQSKNFKFMRSFVNDGEEIEDILKLVK